MSDDMCLPITVSLSSNEAMRPRSRHIQAAIGADDRFALEPMGGYQEPPFDLRFSLREEDPIGDGLCNISEKVFHVELKDFSEDNSSDYLSSILSGHLYEQILAARERPEPIVVVVLGDDSDVGSAIRKAASHATGGHGVNPEKLMEYYRMVEGFEANCIALGVHVWRLKTDPWKRLLLRVRKIMEGGDLTGFAPAPADGERQAVGMSILAGKGIGPLKASAILEKFRICLEPRQADTYLNDCAGIGPKLADVVGKAMNVPPERFLRPKVRKSSRMVKEAVLVCA